MDLWRTWMIKAAVIAHDQFAARRNVSTLATS
jgi:hypothetical protein